MHQLLDLYARFLASNIILAFESGMPHVIDGVVRQVGCKSVIRCSYLEHELPTRMSRGFGDVDAVIIRDIDKVEKALQDSAMMGFLKLPYEKRGRLILEVDDFKNLGEKAAGHVCKVHRAAFTTWKDNENNGT